MKQIKSDFLVIGSGLAGMAFALKAAPMGSVTMLSKATASMANTSWAQGGIAAVISEEDSFASHINDTLQAGAGLCDPKVVENFIQQAPNRIQDLIDWGVQFDIKSNLSKSPTNSAISSNSSSHLPSSGTQPSTTKLSSIDLTREGGHSFRRILHHEDTTGAEIHRALLQKVQANPAITILENHLTIDLILNKMVDPKDMNPSRCIGAYVLDKSTGEVHIFTAKHVILATGGAGKVYLYTSNWSGATGDGVAVAYRAGARVANLEFMQFHPTCLYHKDSRNFLISEALRGEGGELINSHGEAFMKKHHPLGSLAPRDIVARGIDAEIKKSGAPCVYLDMTSRTEDYLQNRFPKIYQQCLEYGINIAKTPIPVVPAAHYLCGGVVTDMHGRTDIAGLWAIGETACTGFHGANRLASNSLLECLVMAHNCHLEIQKDTGMWTDYPMTPAAWVHPQHTDEDEMIVIHHMWDEIRSLMWNYVGIVRSNKRLERAANRLQNILAEVKEYYSHFKVHSDIIELRNIAIVADLTIRCALKRKESRGIHYNIDYPKLESADRAAQDSILYRS